MIWWAIGALVAFGILDRVTRGRSWLRVGLFGALAAAFLMLVAVIPKHVDSIPAAAVSNEEKPPELIWQARTNTLACETLKSIQAVQFLDAVGGSKGLRNPASDASQTDCAHLGRGTKIGVYTHQFAEGISSVHVPGGGGVRYMISADIEVGK